MWFIDSLCYLLGVNQLGAFVALGWLIVMLMAGFTTFLSVMTKR